MKTLSVHQLQQQPAVEENMSNLTTSASGEASVSSNNNAATYPVKKKRNQPGHPEPGAEVIALSPKTLMATNRFVCEICNKGFQRDQNLQLHRRGHNLPWKLKQRASKEVARKKVYVCPEASCVHHDPSRALGDLTGIKKHFCRKHGEKKWKCDKCSKRYAVQSDWKAHSKTCGTREYRCDCGTLFSRRDSFITHRAFCDALAEETARSSSMASGNTTTTSTTTTIPTQLNLQSQFRHGGNDQFPQFSVKKEEQQQQGFTIRPEIPPWLVCPPSSADHHRPLPPPQPIDLPTPSSSSSSIFHHQNPNPSSIGLQQQEPTTTLPPYLLPLPPSSPHISATALLQKAAQMGAKSSCPLSPAGVVLIRPHHQAHVSAAGQPGITTTTTTATAGLDLSSRDGLVNGLAACGNKAAAATVAGGGGTLTGDPTHNPTPFLFHDSMMMMMNGGPGLEGPAFGDMGFAGLFSHHHDHHHPSSRKDRESRLDFDATQLGHEGMTTRDFLGLRNLSHSDILSMAGFSNCVRDDNTPACNQQEQQTVPKSWQG